MMLVWDGLVAVFLFLWTIGIVTELQRSEIIDLSRLLHLPVSLSGRVSAQLSRVALEFDPGADGAGHAGLDAGLVLGRGLAMALSCPLVLAFFFMVTAWTYCLRGWLAALMVNKRRRRTVIMGVTLAFVLLANCPIW